MNDKKIEPIIRVTKKALSIPEIIKPLKIEKPERAKPLKYDTGEKVWDKQIDAIIGEEKTKDK